ncbi:hypothetical protein RE428_16250 [Marinobacter nanhaiticus D15-8W]|nr:hypothetical protein RE428_16250 [Marinobacter nanhaiticus D15-8W]
MGKVDIVAGKKVDERGPGGPDQFLAVTGEGTELALWHQKITSMLDGQPETLSRLVRAPTDCSIMGFESMLA